MAKKIITYSANEFTNVKDIKGTLLYTKDNYAISYLRIYFYNIDLLSDEERKSKAAILAASFKGDRKDFVYFTYPREIDLDHYKNVLKKKYQEEIHNLGKKHLLQEMLLEGNELATNGENYEHQHFIKIWRELGSGNDRKYETENELRARMQEFQARYAAIGIHTEILKEQNIMKMCNLFGNALQAPFTSIGKNNVYDAIAKMR